MKLETKGFLVTLGLWIVLMLLLLWWLFSFSGCGDVWEKKDGKICWCTDTWCEPVGDRGETYCYCVYEECSDPETSSS